MAKSDQERLQEWACMDVLPLARVYLSAGEAGAECEDRRTKESYRRDLEAITSIAVFRFGMSVWAAAQDEAEGR